LTDKVVIVVGGASGLGAATAIRLGLEGSRVVVGDIAEEAAHETADRIVTAGGRDSGGVLPGELGVRR
jgi:NAD(P)-dependent dehydrogenase (short-subunit alcohol dehydrogenase family)